MNITVNLPLETSVILNWIGYSLSLSHVVRSISSVPEATSDSDDEDKLHIVEEDSIADDPDQKSSVFQLKAARQLSDTCIQEGE